MTVDPELVRAGQEAVDAGRAESMSGWVSAALAERVEKERHLRALAHAIAAYEHDAGVISDEEMADQRRADRESATVVRGARRKPAKKSASR